MADTHTVNDTVDDWLARIKLDRYAAAIKVRKPPGSHRTVYNETVLMRTGITL
jgi:hypothetical protein